MRMMDNVKKKKKRRGNFTILFEVLQVYFIANIWVD
jgi:hypothetical protein